ncbi:hypothetical protein HDU97_001325 [Phlyctochytrium planicorne]|nr:hypothetical protein HDU97_001325 [Phlyctochytrium planicorne]
MQITDSDLTVLFRSAAGTSFNATSATPDALSESLEAFDDAISMVLGASIPMGLHNLFICIRQALYRRTWLNAIQSFASFCQLANQICFIILFTQPANSFFKSNCNWFSHLADTFFFLFQILSVIVLIVRTTGLFNNLKQKIALRTLFSVILAVAIGFVLYSVVTKSNVIIGNRCAAIYHRLTNTIGKIVLFCLYLFLLLAFCVPAIKHIRSTVQFQDSSSLLVEIVMSVSMRIVVAIVGFLITVALSLAGVWGSFFIIEFAIQNYCGISASTFEATATTCRETTMVHSRRRSVLKGSGSLPHSRRNSYGNPSSTTSSNLAVNPPNVASNAITSTSSNAAVGASLNRGYLQVNFGSDVGEDVEPGSSFFGTPIATGSSTRPSNFVPNGPTQDPTQELLLEHQHRKMAEELRSSPAPSHTSFASSRAPTFATFGALPDPPVQDHAVDTQHRKVAAEEALRSSPALSNASLIRNPGSKNQMIFDFLENVTDRNQRPPQEDISRGSPALMHAVPSVSPLPSILKATKHDEIMQPLTDRFQQQMRLRQGSIDLPVRTSPALSHGSLASSTLPSILKVPKHDELPQPRLVRSRSDGDNLKRGRSRSEGSSFYTSDVVANILFRDGRGVSLLPDPLERQGDGDEA